MFDWLDDIIDSVTDFFGSDTIDTVWDAITDTASDYVKGGESLIKPVKAQKETSPPMLSGYSQGAGKHLDGLKSEDPSILYNRWVSRMQSFTKGY